MFLFLQRVRVTQAPKFSRQSQRVFSKGKNTKLDGVRHSYFVLRILWRCERSLQLWTRVWRVAKLKPEKHSGLYSSRVLNLSLFKTASKSHTPYWEVFLRFSNFLFVSFRCRYNILLQSYFSVGVFESSDSFLFVLKFSCTLGVFRVTQR